MSQLESISAGNAWLAEKAGINSAQKGGDTEDSAVCPECMKTHHAVYHDEEPCDECCDKILLDNVIGMARRGGEKINQTASSASPSPPC